MSLTREQFLAGAIFQPVGVKYYRFQFVGTTSDITKDHFGHLVVFEGSTFQRREYHCNVVAVQKNRFKVLTTLVGKCVYAWRNFDDMIFISDDPEKKVD